MQALWMIVASLLFACMGVCVKLGADIFSSGELVFYRGLLGMLIMAAIAYTQRISVRTSRWQLHFTRSLAGSIAILFNFYAMTILPLATAVTLNYTSPIFIVILLLLWFRERLRWQAMVSVWLGFIGVAVLLQPSLQQNQWLGAGAGLLSGLLASLSYLSVRELGRAGEPDVRTIFWFSAIASLLGLPWVIHHGIAHIDLKGLLILLGVGGCAAFAQLALTRAYRLGKTVVAANLSYSTVIFASLFGLLLWNEHLSASSWIAIALIISSSIGASLASRQPSAAASSEAAPKRND